MKTKNIFKLILILIVMTIPVITNAETYGENIPAKTSDGDISYDCPSNFDFKTEYREGAMRDTSITLNTTDSKLGEVTWGSNSNSNCNNNGGQYDCSYLFGRSDFSGLDANGNEASFVGFCRNGGISDCSSGKGETFKCEEVVFDPGSSDESRNAYEYGVLSILQSAKSDSDFNYVCANMALRVFEMMGPNNTNGNRTNFHNNANRYYINEDYMNSATEIFGSTDRGMLEGFNTQVTWTDGGTDITSSMNNCINDLVSKGLEASKNYKEKGAVKIEHSGPRKTDNSLVYTLDFKGFNIDSDKKPWANIIFECAECKNNNISYTLTANGSEITEETNVLELLENGEGSLELEIKFDGGACGDKYKYSLKVRYYDTSANTKAYTASANDKTSATACQEFYVLYADDATGETKIDEGNLNFCSCDSLKAACEKGDQDACAKYDENCAKESCVTYVSNVECSPGESTIDIIEGIKGEGCIDSASPEDQDVLKCIIDNNDEAGNSFENKSLLAGNENCKIYCTEEYHLTMPGAKDANSGRYFNLQASFKGKESCFVDFTVKYEDFVDKEDAARQKVREAYNEWKKWYEGLNAEIRTIPNKYYDVHYCSDNNDSAYSQKVGYSATWRYQKVTETGKVWEEFTYDEDDGENPRCYDCDCDGGKEGNKEKIINDIIKKEKDARDILKASIKEFANMINEYNECSGFGYESPDKGIPLYDAVMKEPEENKKIDAWKMQYSYAPQVRFWYEEEYMNDVITDEFLGSRQGIITPTDKPNQELCKENVSKDYKCNNGIKQIDYDDRLDNKWVCHCTDEECSNFDCDMKEILVSKAKYVKQWQESSSEYETPTQFATIHPSGAIVVTQSDGNIENATILENSLPVKLKNNRNVYTYGIIVSDLGEFYSEGGGLGRIWGSEKSVVNAVLQKCNKGSLQKELRTDSIRPKNTGANYNNGVYVCSYRLDCPDCPISCANGSCSLPDPDRPCVGNNCPVHCEKCAFSDGKKNYSYKVISTGNVNPNKRTMGANWNETTEFGLKASATIAQIEEKGEEIYNINFEDSSSWDELGEVAFKIKVDGNLIRKTKEYNKGKNYFDNSLTCYDYGNYKNVYCYSKYIDMLVRDLPNNIAITGNRPLDEAERKNTDKYAYFTTWDKASSSNWNTNTSSSINISSGYGPSWR